MSNTRCDGQGHCFIQGDQLKYYPDLTFNSQPCPHRCQLVKCANFLVCQALVPQWLLQTTTVNTICQECDINWGKELTFLSKGSCCICLDEVEADQEDKMMVAVPGCHTPIWSHMMCPGCFINYYHLEFEDDPDGEEEPNEDCPICRKEREEPAWSKQSND